MRADSSRFPLRRLAVAGSLICMFGFGVAIGMARAADQNLADAQNSLQKATALLEASVAGVADPKAVHRFERKLDRALHHIERANEAIEAARQAVDG